LFCKPETGERVVEGIATSMNCVNHLVAFSEGDVLRTLQALLGERLHLKFHPRNNKVSAYARVTSEKMVRKKSGANAKGGRTPIPRRRSLLAIVATWLALPTQKVPEQ